MTQSINRNIKNLRKGDELFIIKSNNGASVLNNSLVTIVSNNGNGNYTVTSKNSTVYGNFHIYSTSKADEFIIPTKESYIEYYSEKIADLKNEIKKMESELEFHEKYDSPEEFVADKIEQLLKADTKEARIELLKTLKHTHIL